MMDGGGGRCQAMHQLAVLIGLASSACECIH